MHSTASQQENEEDENAIMQQEVEITADENETIDENAVVEQDEEVKLTSKNNNFISKFFSKIPWKEIPWIGLASVATVYLCEDFGIVGNVTDSTSIHEFSTNTISSPAPSFLLLNDLLHVANNSILNNNNSTWVDEDAKSKVGYYAGLMASAYSIGQFCNGLATSILIGLMFKSESKWSVKPFLKSLSNNKNPFTLIRTIFMKYIFRPRVLLFASMLFTGVMNIFFGLGLSYWYSFSIRFLSGLFNGNTAIAKGYLAIIVNEKTQSMAYSMLTTVWGFGQMLGPSIAGFLSRPTKNYPELFEGNAFFTQFPYFLPCVFCGSLMIVGAFVCFITTKYYTPEEIHGTTKQQKDSVEEQKLISETADNDQSADREMDEFNSSKDNLLDEIATQKQLESNEFADGQAEINDDIMIENGDQLDVEDSNLETKEKSVQSDSMLHTLKQYAKIIFSREVLVCYFLYLCCIEMEVLQEELFPLWTLIDFDKGGLGFDTKDIGVAQAIMGFFFIFLPFLYPLMEKFCSKLTLYRLALLNNMLMFFTPQIRFFRLESWGIYGYDTLSSILLWTGIVFYSLLRCNASNIIFTSVCIFLNNSAPTDKASSVMALSNSIQSLAFLSGPLIGGPLLSFSIQMLKDYVPLFFYMNVSFSLVSVIAGTSLLFSFLLSPSINSAKLTATSH